MDVTLTVCALQSKLNPLFRPGRVWEYADLCLLMDIARRPEPLVECDIIVEYHAKMVASGRKQFFPQSAYNVLSRWSELLDKAWSFTSEAAPVSKQAQEIIALQKLKLVDADIKTLKGKYFFDDSWDNDEARARFTFLCGVKKQLLGVLGLR